MTRQSDFPAEKRSTKLHYNGQRNARAAGVRSFITLVVFMKYCYYGPSLISIYAEQRCVLKKILNIRSDTSPTNLDSIQFEYKIVRLKSIRRSEKYPTVRKIYENSKNFQKLVNYLKNRKICYSYMLSVLVYVPTRRFCRRRSNSYASQGKRDSFQKE